LTNHSRKHNAILNLTVIDRYAYCLRLTALRFCMCHGLKGYGTQKN